MTITKLDGLVLINTEDLPEGASAAVIAIPGGHTVTDHANAEYWIRVTGVRVVSEGTVRIEGEWQDGRLFTQFADRGLAVIARLPEGSDQ